MTVTVFLMCYNEQVLLPSTVRHYRTLFPGCDIVVCDNESTDRSVGLAAALGCRVHSFATGNVTDERVMLGVKNNVWKSLGEGWVIVCDMDEYLCIDARRLEEEARRGTTLLTTRGFEIVGTSESPELADVDLALCDKGYFSRWYSKKVCFDRTAIAEINYAPGCHQCRPVGRIVASATAYPLYHMSCLGLPHFLGRQKRAFARAGEMRKIGLCIHYSDDEAEIRGRFRRRLEKCTAVPTLASLYRGVEADRPPSTGAGTQSV